MEQQFPYLDERRAVLWQRVRCSAIVAAAVEARRRSRPVRLAVTPCELVLEGGGGERGRGGGRGDGAEEGPGGRPPPGCCSLHPSNLLQISVYRSPSGPTGHIL